MYFTVVSFACASCCLLVAGALGCCCCWEVEAGASEVGGLGLVSGWDLGGSEAGCLEVIMLEARRFGAEGCELGGSLTGQEAWMSVGSRLCKLEALCWACSIALECNCSGSIRSCRAGGLGVSRFEAL